MDITDIPKPEINNTRDAEPDEEQHPEYKKITLAKCGMDCTQCRFAEENDCPGCMQGHLFDDEECPVYDCCVRKGFVHCGECGSFPCAELRDTSFDVETGDGGNRLMRLKELRDKDDALNSRRVTCILTGFILGLTVGIVIGAVSGQMASWIFACITAGCGIGAIISLSGGKR